MYDLHEIFYSIQGEGFHSGSAAVFVRFARCNLKCRWCDTDFRGNPELFGLSAESVVARIAAAHAGSATKPMVIFTGGEPTLQLKPHPNVARAVKQAGYYTAIETNGTVRITDELFHWLDWITVSPKKYEKGLVKQLYANECKLVWTDEHTEADLLEAEEFSSAGRLYLQPESMRNTEAVIDIIKRRPQWKLSIQTHKYLNLP